MDNLRYSRTPVEGGKVCATCPTSCCGSCASRFGYIGRNELTGEHLTKEKIPALPENPNIPNELLELAKIKETKYWYEVDYPKEFKRLLDALSEKLGYQLKFNSQTGFRTANGCSFKREHRSVVCTNYQCIILRVAIDTNSTDKRYNDVYPKTV